MMVSGRDAKTSELVYQIWVSILLVMDDGLWAAAPVPKEQEEESQSFL